MARGGSREDVQDRILNQMDKANRNSDRPNGAVLSLKEQLDKEKAWQALTPEEKLRRMSFGDWVRAIEEHAQTKRVSLTSRFMQLVSSNNGRPLQMAFRKHHELGTSLSEVVSWLQDEQLNHW
jgi:hypothetical protein